MSKVFKSIFVQMNHVPFNCCCLISHFLEKGNTCKDRGFKNCFSGRSSSTSLERIPIWSFLFCVWDLKGKVRTIKEFGFLIDPEKDEPYACIVTAEEPTKFYFTGSVITEQLKVLEDEGYREEIENEGLPFISEQKKGKKSGNKYWAISFYPEG